MDLRAKALRGGPHQPGRLAFGQHPRPRPRDGAVHRRYRALQADRGEGRAAKLQPDRDRGAFPPLRQPPARDQRAALLVRRAADDVLCRQLSPRARAAPAVAKGTDVITEICCEPAALERVMGELREYARRDEVDIVSATVRVVEQ